jgi:hypothetical protein
VFDLRYHVASLAAVFLALAVGILLGVAISGKLSTAEESLSAAQIDDLNRRLAAASTRADAADRRREAAEDLVEEAYPVLIQNRLADRHFALLFVGPVQGEVSSAVEQTLDDAGASTPRLVALDAPIDGDGLDDALRRNDTLAAYADDDGDFGELGEALGRELAEEGETPLWTALSSELVQERSGSPFPAVDGAIIAYSWEGPPTDQVEETREVRSTTTLVEGLLRGLDDTGSAVVGVETSNSARSRIDVYRREGISTVDDIDTLAGRLALAVVLAGGQEGHYGVKDSASDGVAPPIEPLPESSG